MLFHILLKMLLVTHNDANLGVFSLKDYDSGTTSSSLCHRYVPNHLYLAIHELDESNVGRFSFRNRESIVQVRGFCYYDDIFFFI